MKKLNLKTPLMQDKRESQPDKGLVFTEAQGHKELM